MTTLYVPIVSDSMTDFAFMFMPHFWNLWLVTSNPFWVINGNPF